MSAAVSRKVAKRVGELLLPEEMSSEGGLDCDGNQPFTHKCRPLKSGLDRTVETMVVHNIIGHMRWCILHKESLQSTRSCQCLLLCKDTY